MELNLDKYSSKQILIGYELVFAQYLGGQLLPPEDLEIALTPYVFGEVCTELRKQYLSRTDSIVEELLAVEKDVISRLANVMNISDKKLREVYEDMLIQAEKTLRELGRNVN